MRVALKVVRIKIIIFYLMQMYFLYLSNSNKKYRFALLTDMMNDNRFNLTHRRFVVTVIWCHSVMALIFSHDILQSWNVNSVNEGKFSLYFVLKWPFCWLTVSLKYLKTCNVFQHTFKRRRLSFALPWHVNATRSVNTKIPVNYR